jgi:predicted HD superfamily hydrolase involved in NAD metabolism
MKLDHLIEATKKELPAARFEHTIRVKKLAVKFASQMGIDRERTSIAAILHDYCKYWPKEQLASWIRKYDLPSDLLDYHHALWHAPVGAEVAARQFQIEDEEILQAIRYHTTGRPHMSPLEKIIFLADLIEPGRHFPGVEELRTLAEKDVDRAIWKALDHTICYLIEKCQKIHPLTWSARNYFLEIVVDSDLREESI